MLNTMNKRVHFWHLVENCYQKGFLADSDLDFFKENVGRCDVCIKKDQDFKKWLLEGKENETLHKMEYERLSKKRFFGCENCSTELSPKGMFYYMLMKELDVFVNASFPEQCFFLSKKLLENVYCKDFYMFDNKCSYYAFQGIEFATKQMRYYILKVNFDFKIFDPSIEKNMKSTTYEADDLKKEAVAWLRLATPSISL